MTTQPSLSPELLDALENLIAPGGRARLSPYVETTQVHALFGIIPDFKHRVRDIKHLIDCNASQVQEIAERWATFCRLRKPFNRTTYTDTKFLQSYLIYYFSTNVSKIQICLLDLLRAGELTESELHLADIGLGTATTFIAVLDFLSAWQTICHLYNVPFPVEKVHLTGFDQNPTVLNYAKRIMDSYGLVLAQRAENIKNLSFAVFQDAISAASFHEWELDRSEQPPVAVRPNLVHRKINFLKVLTKATCSMKMAG